MSDYAIVQWQPVPWRHDRPFKIRLALYAIAFVLILIWAVG